MYSDQASRLQQQQRNLLSDRLSALTNVIAFESYRKFIQIQLHNIDQTWAQKLKQTSASMSWPYISFEDLTKIQLQNLEQISASKYWPKIYSKSWPNFSFNIVTKIQFQNL